jgi:hypothetical protein
LGPLRPQGWLGGVSMDWELGGTGDGHCWEGTDGGSGEEEFAEDFPVVGAFVAIGP